VLLPFLSLKVKIHQLLGVTPPDLLK